TDAPAPALSALSLHDALPISRGALHENDVAGPERHEIDVARQGLPVRRAGAMQREREKAGALREARSGEARPMQHRAARDDDLRSEEHTSELQSRENLVCRLL